MSTYTIRPSNSEKEAFRVKFTAASLLSLKLRPGDLCTLHLPTDDENQPLRIAVAWEASGIKDNIVLTSKTLQEIYKVKLGDKVNIKRSTEKLQDAFKVNLRPFGNAFSEEEQTAWSLNASIIIPSKHDVLVPSQKVVLEIGPRKEEFEVESVGGLIARVTAQTVFNFGSGTNSKGGPRKIKLSFEGIGGLQNQIKQVEEVVEELVTSRVKLQWKRFRPRQGLLLYGAKGTGKTILQDALAQGEWSKVTRWTSGLKLVATLDPQLVIIDFDHLRDRERLVPEILAMFGAIRETPTLILGSVRHPNDLPEQLRSRQAFSEELELPIPDAEQRLDILRAMREDSIQPDDDQLQEIAAKTHGFVGADLDLLLHRAWATASSRVSKQQEFNGDPPVEEDDTDNLPLVSLTPEDLEQAFSHIRPSALQEIFLEKPNIHWSDIGGQHELKRQLQNAVERPLKHPDRMKRLGLQPKKGILLYGPPGCSKTLTVKALATEAGVNFLAVKGAELISMYVGESEKATREVFRKARQASPSIIFFDEIDAIASRGRTGSDLNVLTTLLNEMDGFEELKNVLVVAATNKPQSIDAALMRPGRFDNAFYIGPPDEDTRREIFEKRFQKVDVADGVREQISEYARLTEGFSGAEVVAICQAAGEKAFDCDREHITEGDVLDAIARTPKSITSEMLEEYERWNQARMTR